MRLAVSYAITTLRQTDLVSGVLGQSRFTTTDHRLDIPEYLGFDILVFNLNRARNILLINDILSTISAHFLCANKPRSCYCCCD